MKSLEKKIRFYKRVNLKKRYIISSVGRVFAKKVAEQGDVYSQMLTAQSYEDGDGVEKNETEALYRYKKAAEQGNVFAQVNVGVCYFYGESVEENKEEAIRWYRKLPDGG